MTLPSDTPDPRPPFPVYDIATVADFATVPLDRLADCMHDFASFLRLSRLTHALLQSAGDVLYPGTIKWTVGGVFQWIDDGKRSATATIEIPGEKSIAIDLDQLNAMVNR